MRCEGTTGLPPQVKVPISVQLAFARQGAKEQAESDDDWRRSDDIQSTPTLALQSPDDKRASEVCVRTCDDARQL
jgi:hypothetical protein